MFNEQLQQKIEQEAQQYFEAMPDIIPYIAWRSGATKYAALWQAAEEKAARYEKALKDFAHRLKVHCENMGITSIVLQRITIDMEEFTLTPKTSEDE